MTSIFDKSINARDKEYKLIRDDSNHSTTRYNIEKLWEIYEQYAEQGFQASLTESFHSRFWEMYLGCTFLSQGYDLIENSGTEHPDICIARNGSQFWIEATAPNQGDGPDKVPSLPRSEPIADRPFSRFSFFRVPEENILLRYTSAIHTKLRQYKSFIAKEIIAESDPYILAINGGNVPLTYDGNDEIPLIVQAILPIGPLEVEIDWENPNHVRSRYSRRTEITKKSGASIPIEFAPQLSGILFSKAMAWQVGEKLGTDFIFVHNPRAVNPVPIGWLEFEREFWLDGDKLMENGRK